MVVAGMVDVDAVMPVFEYEITAHHTAGEYRASGDTVQAVEMVDTYIDVLPSFNMSDYNYMERMWAYLSVRSLLTKVERGQLYSCQPGYQQARYQVCLSFLALVIIFSFRCLLLPMISTSIGILKVRYFTVLSNYLRVQIKGSWAYKIIPLFLDA